MARSDVIIPTIFVPEFYRGSAEKAEVFNEAAAGAITLQNDFAVQEAGGESTQPIRFVTNTGIESRMDHTSSGNASFTPLTQVSGKAIRLNRKMTPVIFDDEVNVSTNNMAEWNVVAARQMAESQLIAQRNMAYGAVIAAIESMDTPSADFHLQGSRVILGGTRVPLTHARLNTLLGLMADAREKIVMLAMPSVGFQELIGAAIALSSLDTVAGATLHGATPASFNNPVLVADVDSLQTAADSVNMADYFVLGMGVGAVSVKVVMQDALEIERDLVSERKNTKLRLDYTVEIAVAGMEWTSGTINPTNAQLATAANWDENLDDHRQCPIVRGRFQTATA